VSPDGTIFLRNHLVSVANMLSDTEASCLAIALVVWLKKEEKKKRRWMKECLKKRNEYTHENLLKDLRLRDFHNFLRLGATSFD
jgi:hypothetical protein